MTKSKVLEGMITIPVIKPTKLIQCGNVSTVYPPEYTKRSINTNHKGESNDSYHRVSR